MTVQVSTYRNPNYDDAATLEDIEPGAVVWLYEDGKRCGEPVVVLIGPFLDEVRHGDGLMAIVGSCDAKSGLQLKRISLQEAGVIPTSTDDGRAAWREGAYVRSLDR